MIEIPYNFKPYPHQLELFKALDNGIKRAMTIVHRRAGKDKTLINLVTKKALEKKGVYFYFYPTYAQARKALWDNIDQDGFKFIDHIPEQVRKNTNSQEMKIELVNGSIIQLIGTDRLDGVRGTNPIGCIFSEYAFHNPQAWDTVRPILTQNGGWAVFNSTPYGKNHLYDLYMNVKDDPEWFVQRLTIEDTKKCDGTPIIDRKDVEQEKKEGMSEDMVQQEFYCSFDAALIGSYYADQMKEVSEQGRIKKIPLESNLDTYAAWDIGRNDRTVITIWQELRNEIRIVNCVYDDHQDAAYFIGKLKELNIRIDHHYLPHDAANKTAARNESYSNVFDDMGISNYTVLEKANRLVGIDRVRKMFPRFYFDEGNTPLLRRALTEYHKEYDEKRKTFKNDPYHDWSSDFADSVRYMCMALEDTKPKVEYSVTQFLNDTSVIQWD